MLFENNRDSLRQIYFECWRKKRENEPLDPLEAQIAAVIQEHPEYHSLLEQPETGIHKEFLPEMGESNPFLHMGMHLGLREQASTNRPRGITELLSQFALKFGEHEAEHHVMECLAESIWLAQQNNTVPDEEAYLQSIKKKLRSL
jgi:hypothetical protein